MSQAAYQLFLPKKRETSVIFASPHSGRDYSADFLAEIFLDEKEIRSSEDAFVDQLFAAAPDFGAPLLVAKAPRAYVDLNRAADELDPALIEGLRRPPHNPRIASGLGVIPRVVANGRAIYHGKIPVEVAHDRLSRIWRPYHDRLQSLIDENLRDFGQAILIDCHSMPREALDQMGHNTGPRPDVVLGDRFGASCGEEIVSLVEQAFVGLGLRVQRNVPFAGAHIVQTYGRPTRHQHALQIEIDRSLYMDEAAIEPSAAFADFVGTLTQAIGQIARIGLLDSTRLAAE
jgi:N-formylglutamate amidohydrolase